MSLKRRELLTYVAPAVVTIAVLPQFASAGSNEASGPTESVGTSALCIDDPMPAHGCKKYLRRHRFD